MTFDPVVAICRLITPTLSPRIESFVSSVRLIELRRLTKKFACAILQLRYTTNLFGIEKFSAKEVPVFDLAGHF